jgi:uncharacterized protein (TIGR00255 family)
MSIRSMTGFGLAEKSTLLGACRVEIRAVNGRFLELQVRQPQFFGAVEQRTRKLVGESVARGSVIVFVSCDRAEENSTLTWDKKAVETYIRIFREIKDIYKLDGEVTLSHLLQFSDLIKNESTRLDEKTIWEEFEPVLVAALADFQKSRAEEGHRTVKDIEKSLKDMRRLLKLIEKRAPQRITEYAAELQKRVKQIAEGVNVDPQRLATEVSLMADRLDISEETSRMSSHLEAFAQTLTSDEQVGKRMNFLLQEMNREANTMGSKANDTQVSHLSVEMKENIEKIRESIQNIE